MVHTLIPDGTDPWGDDVRSVFDQLDANITDRGVNIRDLGGGGLGDDTDLINDAIAEMALNGGGIVYFPPGSYNSTGLIGAPYVSIKGAGMGATTINITAGDSDGYQLLSTEEIDAKISISDLSLVSTESGTGQGINVGFTGTGDPHPMLYFYMDRVRVSGFGSHGVHVAGSILSQINNVTVEAAGGHGFFIDGGYVVGVGVDAIHYGSWATSTQLSNCYANFLPEQSSGLSGYRIQMATYVKLSNCAVDWAGIGYDIYDSSAVTLDTCGVEASQNKSLSYPGYGIKVDGGSTYGSTSILVIGGYGQETEGTGAHWTGDSKGTMIGWRYFNSAGSPPNSLTLSGASTGVLAIGCILPYTRTIEGQFNELMVVDAVGTPMGLSHGVDSPYLLAFHDSIQIIGRGASGNVPLVIKNGPGQNGALVIEDSASQNIVTVYQNTNTPTLAFGHSGEATLAKPDGFNFLATNNPMQCKYYGSAGSLPPAAQFPYCLAVTETPVGTRIVMSDGVHWRRQVDGSDYWQTVEGAP